LLHVCRFGNQDECQTKTCRPLRMAKTCSGNLRVSRSTPAAACLRTTFW
jgi:hypothetical protein